MEALYLITGANGHLGDTMIRFLEHKKMKARGLILFGEVAADTEYTKYFHGDVTKPLTLKAFFDGLSDYEKVICIHTAGIVDISEKMMPRVYDVNVNGTRNIVEMCRRHKIDRLVYVSSVHAIPENGAYGVIREVKSFSGERVTGGYAKTKAEATQLVLEAAVQGMDAVIVHPSGIMGPYDRNSNHLIQLVKDYMTGTLWACVKGGYDFVDVRDVAMGCLQAALKGRKGECYILSNRHYDIKDILAMVRKICGGRKLPVLPIGIARVAAPVLMAYAKRKKRRPLYTQYSLYTLSSNDRFSHDKATRELGYYPRDLDRTLCDTVRWLQKKERVFI